MDDRKTMDLAQRWEFMQKGITKLKNVLQGFPETPIQLTVYTMCTRKPPHDYAQQLYDKYRESFEEFINSVVRN